MNKKRLSKLKIEWIAWGLFAAFLLFATGYATGQQSRSGVYTVKTGKTAGEVSGQTTPASLPSSGAPPSATPAASFDPAAPIDINTADAAELEDLPGIGPALAERIVESRETEGPFAGVDDLERVSGIGKATIEKLRPHTTCGPAPK